MSSGRALLNLKKKNQTQTPNPPKTLPLSKSMHESLKPVQGKKNLLMCKLKHEIIESYVCLFFFLTLSGMASDEVKANCE